MATTSMVSLVTVFQLIIMLISSCTAQSGSNAKFFDVTTYGGVANGKDDNSKVIFSFLTDSYFYLRICDEKKNLLLYTMHIVIFNLRVCDEKKES